ncbi:MAG: isocitrate/isopropylmalate family dehydrogenase, partial [Methanothrix sp.]
MKYKVPVIPGDGIGPEIVAEGQKVLEAAADKYNFSLDWIDFSLGAEHYLKTGELVTEET